MDDGERRCVDGVWMMVRMRVVEERKVKKKWSLVFVRFWAWAINFDTSFGSRYDRRLNERKRCGSHSLEE